jgi:membrane-anchored protein YejM (alkaline phosphatase superfamily)
MGEAVGNTLVQVEYKNFYLYNKNGFEDDAFREHVFSKLEFEELRRVEISDSQKLSKALETLNIVTDKWTNYVSIGYKGGVYYRKWHDRGEYSTIEKLGKLISRTSSK